MANLEIKVDTGDAADKLAELAAGLDKVATAADKAAPSFEKLDEAAKKTGDVKPIDPAVPDSIEKTAAAGEKMGAAAPGIDSAATAMGKVGEAAGSLSSAAASLEQVAAAQEKVAESGAKASQASEGLNRFAEGASKAGEGARNTEAAVAAADSAFTKIGQQAMNVAEHMTGFGGAAGFVTKAFNTIMEVGGGLPGVFAAVATAIAALDFNKISEEALKAAMQVENLQRSLNAFSKEAHAAPEALEILDKTADRLGLNLEKLEKNFGKWAAVATSAGFSNKWAATSFDAVENAARATGTGLEGAQRVLRTLETWMSNGTMTAGLLGRSLRDVGMTLDQIDPKFKNLTRNTQIGNDAIIKLLVAMNNMKTVALVLQEEIERVANSWTMMLGAFGRGQMASEVDSMKFLADTMHHAQSELNSFAYAAGALWGVLQSVFNYIEAAAVGVFAGLIDAVKTVWDVMSKATFVADEFKAAWNGAGGAAKDVGGIFSFLGGEILNTIKVLSQLVVILTFGWVWACREAGEAVGIFAGALAGALYLALMKVIGAIGSFIDWMNQGLESMKAWMASGLPEWLSGPLINAIEGVQKFFRQVRDEWNEGTAAAARLRGEQERLKPALEESGKAAEDAARKQRQLTLENEALAKSATKAMEAEIAKRAAIIMSNPDQDARDDADAAWKRSQATANAWSQKIAQDSKSSGHGGGGGGGGGPLSQYGQPLGPSGMGVDQYARPGGVYSGSDLIHGTGRYYERSGSLMTDSDTIPRNNAARNAIPGTDPMTGLSNGLLRGGQVGPQDNFNNPLADAFTKAGDEFSQKLRDGLTEALNNPNGLDQRLDALKNEVALEVAAGQDMAAGLIGFADTVGTVGDQFATGIDTMSGEFNNVTDGLSSLANGMDGLSGEVKDNTAQTMDNTGSLIVNSSRTDYNTRAEEANTAATDALSGEVQADTAANYADAAAQGGGNNSGGNGGGGGQQQDAQASSTTQYDVGGIVGQWGGRRGPGLPMSAWANAPHFADGGITDGGIPIVAHPNEAIIPLQGGAIPVHMSGGLDVQVAQRSASIMQNVNQSIKDDTEKSNAIGTVAHEDAVIMINLLQKIANGSTDLMAAFNTVAARLEAAAAANASRSSGGSSSRSSSTGGGGGFIAGLGDGMNLGGGETSIGGGAGGVPIGGNFIKKGWWGTSGGGGYLHPSALQSRLAAWGMLGQDKLPNNMGGAADGLENTNMLPGMTSAGLQLTVHPSEAIIPLPDGRSVPVRFTDDSRGGGSQRGGGRSVNNSGNVHVSMTVHAKDVQSFKRSEDQIMQAIDAKIRQSRRVIGTIDTNDDPTVRPTGWGGQAPGMTSVRGTPKF